MKKKYIIGLFILALLGFSTLWCYRHFSGLTTPKPSALPDSLNLVKIHPPQQPETLYGFEKDSFIIREGRIKYAQNLATILGSHGVDYSITHNLATSSKEVFDVRRLKAGNAYTIFFEEKDTVTTPAWFVYDIDNINYVVMSLKGDPLIYHESKEVITQRKSAVGVIESSLWNAIKDNNLNPNLALELSEIFAWTVDFFGIEKGDNFTVIYDEQYVDSIPVGIGNIHAAYFNHRNTPYYAFRYEQDSIMSYFDEEGASLRKAFLKAPLKFSRISSRFSHNRLHPILKIRRPHLGIDYAAPTGTPVFALGDGRVTHRTWDTKGGGNYIKIRHNSIYRTVYMHLSNFAKGIRKGDVVKQGQLIGYVGKTGLATGPHLDFRIYKNGKPIDPLKVEAPPVEPISKEELQAYLKYIKPWKQALNNLTNTVSEQRDTISVDLKPFEQSRDNTYIPDHEFSWQEFGGYHFFQPGNGPEK
jgi:murein DD-endopeptidase MepM/ murein hydrolase activator NlpD